ncbi:MAG: TetR/AcrR family transcriptional regulator [Bacillota bacterium]
MEKKKLIIEATIDLINEFGFLNFSIGKVANKINVSKGVISYHFPTKELLLQSVVMDYYENASKYMEQHIRLDKGAMDTLSSYIESCLYFSYENKKQTITIVDIVLNCRNKDGELLFQGDDSSIYQPLIEIFKYGQEVEKVYRNFSPEFMAKCIRNVIDSVSVAIAKNEIDNVDEAIREVKTIFESATKL